MNETDSKFYGRSWYDATKIEARARPTLTSDLDVEICVIGGGLAGLTAAREIARSRSSVVLLEAGRLAGGASGRNTGFVLPGFAADTDGLISRVGFEQTKDLWALSEAGLDYVRNTITAERANAFDAQGWLYVSKRDNGEQILRLTRLLGDLGCDAEYWPTDHVRTQLRSERYFHAVHYRRAFTIHPLNYALTLAAGAERDGALIFENTPALSIDPAGVRKRIVTPQGRLRASQVVLAGNVQIKRLMPRLAATLVPVTTYVITTAPLGAERLAQAVLYRGAVSDTDLADNHYRIVGGDRLMWLGRATVWPGNPRHYVRALTADIGKTYPQLGKVDVDYAWAGTLGNTVHRMPQIGELGPGVWLASGFGGHGLNTTALAGNLIARAVVAGDPTWRKFSPFELVWAGGLLGRAAVQMRVWLRRLFVTGVERRTQTTPQPKAAGRAQTIVAPEAGSPGTSQTASPPEVPR